MSEKTWSNDTISMNDKQVRVLTLNCWGLKLVSKLRPLRLEAISAQLAQDGDSYDIVCLQEVWVESDFDQIKKACVDHFPYTKYYYSGIIAGPGLAVLSRWPIESAYVHRFGLNGRPSAFFRGDWYVGKSVASATIIHPSNHRIEILNAHMHAPYGPGDANYTCHRTSQAWEMARIAKRSMDAGNLTIVTGDLNSRPSSLTHQLFENMALLQDAWESRHGEFSGDLSEMTPEQQIEEAGVTCNSRLNSWRASRPLSDACRLDYIFFDPSRATVREARVAFTDKIEGGCSVSDHFGVSAVFELTPQDKSRHRKVSSATLTTMFDEFLALVTTYKGTSITQARVRNWHFMASILVVIGLLVSVWWAAADNRAYVGFIYILAAVAIAVTGVVDGLIGYLFGNTEMRALLELESELELAKRMLAKE
ncbi:YALIA101S11e00298g1_1 [Yarrowia lipolytica]|nr:YALIA101S11e00298g1_1 [Yarrowia lipolytica]